MRVLVTGARGFLGSHVLRALSARGIDVRVLTRAPASSAAGDMVVGDAADPRVADLATRDIDAVIHLAARVHVLRETAVDPLAEFRRANVEPTSALAAAARANGARVFIFASSVKAVGETTTRPLSRAAPAAPRDAYGVSKREAEIVLRTLADGPMRVVPVRLPLLYGPGMKANMLILMRLVDRGAPVPVGTSGNARSLLYVGNAAAAFAHLAASGAPAADGDPYFLSDGAPATRDLVREIGAALGVRARTIAVPAGAARVTSLAIDTLLRGRPRLRARVDRLFGSLEVDASDFLRDFAFDLPYSRMDGLRATAAWYRTLPPAGHIA